MENIIKARNAYSPGKRLPLQCALYKISPKSYGPSVTFGIGALDLVHSLYLVSYNFILSPSGVEKGGFCSEQGFCIY